MLSAGCGLPRASSPPPAPPPPPIDTGILAYVDGATACVPFAEATDSPWVDGALLTAILNGSLTLGEELAAAQQALVGGWVGIASVDFGTGLRSWLARFDFAADGTYTAAGRVGDSSVPPLYYGDTEQCPPAPWSFLDVTAVGLEGDLTVEFSNSASCYLPAWQGLWSAVHWDASNLRMRFSFSTSDGYGPINFDLHRACGTTTNDGGPPGATDADGAAGDGEAMASPAGPAKSRGRG